MCQPVPPWFWLEKPKLIEFGFEFEFSPILKDEFGAGNENIDTHYEFVPEHVPLILNEKC
jgi:hypothetical protein